MLDAYGHELRQVARRKPDRQPPLVYRRRIDVADAHQEHLHTVFVGVQAAHGLTEHLGHAIASVRLDVDAVVYGLLARIETDGMVGSGKQDALHPIPARGLEHVVATDDVGAEYAFPRALDRITAEVHDRVYTLGDAQRVGHVRN